MFKALKGHTKTWSSKIIIVLLALSFAVWGISDVFRSGGSDTIAIVGETEIAVETILREFNAETRRIQSRFPEFNSETAKKMGLPSQVLGSLVEQALLVEEARSAGMVVPDSRLAERIVSENPGLLNKGVFDIERYERALQRSGQSLEGFESGVRDEILRRQVTDSLGTTGMVPLALSQMLNSYIGERRDIIILYPPKDKLLINRSTEQELKEYYETFSDKYILPETRSIVLLELTLDSIESDLAIDDEDIYAEYEYRLDEFEKPERRTVAQILSSNEQLIVELSDALDEGKDFDYITKLAVDSGADYSELKNLTKNSMPLEAQNIVFSLPKGKVSPPIKTGFGWHLFIVREISSAGVMSFEEAKPLLYEELLSSLSIDALYGLSGSVEDSLSGGNTLEEAAETIGLSVSTINSLERSGVSLDGRRPLNMNPSEKEILETIFELSESETSALIETKVGGYFILRVDTIEQESVKPFIDSRAEVEADLLRSKIRDESLVIVKSASEEIISGLPIDKVVQNKKLTSKYVKGLSRASKLNSEIPSQEFLDKIFASPPNPLDPVILEGLDNFLIAIITNSYQEDVSDNENDYKARIEAIGKNREEDVLLLYRFALQQKHNIEVNGNIFEQLFAAP